MSASGILVVNAGSSSIKFAMFEVVDPGGVPGLLYQGLVDRVDTSHAHFHASDGGGRTLADSKFEAKGGKGLDHTAMLETVLDWLDSVAGEFDLIAAGHRVVHGGDEFSRPILIDPSVIARLEGLIPLAPLHQPHNIEAIRALARSRPGLPQVACFDTAFHAGQPELARRLALPRELHDAGIKRYGFHGLSYEYIASVLPEHLGDKAGGRIVVAHLGNGASMCAIRQGRSVATTMGFTALDGLVMGTRCGLMDPGVILHLLEERHMTTAEITDLLYRRSGLLGVSGISSDMRVLLESPSPQAREAVELFVYRISRELGSLAAALGGLDALLFTGGIGARSPVIRSLACRAASWLGVDLDESANRAHGPRISTPRSRTSAWVIPTNEELMIARHVLDAIAR
jgi:acetate kinase